jgi:hypothetical protein
MVTRYAPRPGRRPALDRAAVTGRKLFFSLALAAVVAWRVAARPAEAWRDVPAILALYGLWSVWRRGPDPALPAAAYLLGLYLASQAPRILETFR